MDRIFSARIDDTVFRKIGDLSAKMQTSKKAIIEKAVRLLGQRFEEDNEHDVFDETCGTWNRSEAPREIASRARTAFTKSMTRHYR